MEGYNYSYILFYINAFKRPSGNGGLMNPSFLKILFFRTQQRKHVVAKVLSITKNLKIFKKTSTMTFIINYEGFSRGLNGCSL